MCFYRPRTSWPKSYFLTRPTCEKKIGEGGKEGLRRQTAKRGRDREMRSREWRSTRRRIQKATREAATTCWKKAWWPTGATSETRCMRRTRRATTWVTFWEEATTQRWSRNWWSRERGGGSWHRRVGLTEALKDSGHVAKFIWTQMTRHFTFHAKLGVSVYLWQLINHFKNQSEILNKLYFFVNMHNTCTEYDKMCSI